MIIGAIFRTKNIQNNITSSYTTIHQHIHSRCYYNRNTFLPSCDGYDLGTHLGILNRLDSYWRNERNINRTNGYTIHK